MSNARGRWAGYAMHPRLCFCPACMTPEQFDTETERRYGALATAPIPWPDDETRQAYVEKAAALPAKRWHRFVPPDPLLAGDPDIMRDIARLRDTR